MISYLNTVERLQAEANISLRNATAADNVDLLLILQEYENFYSIKFGKPPKLTRKANESDQAIASQKAKQRTPPSRLKSSEALNPSPATYQDGKSSSRGGSLPLISNAPGLTAREKPLKPVTKSVPAQKKGGDPSAVQGDGEFNIVGTTVSKREEERQTVSEEVPVAADLYTDRLLKPLPEYGNAEFRELASIITRDIFIKNPNVRWTDIAGLDKTKKLVKEAVVYPMKFPQYVRTELKNPQ
ncbi:Katanin p60 ATPase-containing subunit A-like 2 [Rhizophlyctis rosea]|uniref:Katanin p60 ATPase-containing subunit A-like 2 n=1 Tax=Rhizophlyctis rosea TaxID=64517 RepID=A0AAD5SIS1_9FUNG|nr:Katanin p60 ATPase-containing subunit A-like 2 [Rhizophlyctis rosea]